MRSAAAFELRESDGRIVLFSASYWSFSLDDGVDTSDCEQARRRNEDQSVGIGPREKGRKKVDREGVGRGKRSLNRRETEA